MNFVAIETDIGNVMIAATEKGIASVRIGNDQGRLISDLEAEFPGTRLVENRSALKAWARAIGELARGGKTVDIPLDIRSTPFQAAVWKAIAAIPKGEVRSYQEIAIAVGKPTAPRAVGRACGENPVALLIPCHRVVRSDGGLGGYGWGLEIKRRLLRAEGALA